MEQSDIDAHQRALAERMREELFNEEVDSEIERAMREVDMIDNAENTNMEEEAQEVDLMSVNSTEASLPNIEATGAIDISDLSNNTTRTIDPNVVRANPLEPTDNSVFYLGDIENQIKAVDKGKVIAYPSSEVVFRAKILRIASSVLGEENVSIDENGSYKLLILKWPFIHITNRDGLEHDIVDMYVGLPISSDRFNGSLQGVRGTLSALEARVGYRHSHLLPTSNNFSTFCTGADGINDLWANLQLESNLREEFEIELEAFIHQLESFLSYESLEGVPYFRIKNIRVSPSNGLSSVIINDEAFSITNSMSVSDIELYMDFNSGKGGLVETEHIHSFMASETTYHQMRMPNGTYSNIGEAQQLSSSSREVSGSKFIFKGVTSKIKVNSFQVENNNNDSKIKRYANGQITEGIKQAFEAESEYLIRESCIKNSVSNQNEGLREIGVGRRFDSANSLLIINSVEQGVVGSPVLEIEQGSGSRETEDDNYPF